MNHLKIDENLQYRIIPRGDDMDYFIETSSYPVHLASELSFLSRIQFPTSRAILVRTSPHTSMITVHILKDVDLYSSFVNFEIDLTNQSLHIIQQDHCIDLSID